MNENKEKLLEIRDLSVTYITDDATLYAVNGLNLDLYRGETLGLVGETGAGKTTTATTIMRLLPERVGKITSGNIQFDNVNITKASEAEMRALRGRRISMIFQDPMTCLNPVLTVGDQVSEVLETHGIHDKTELSNRVDELLNLVGIPAERKKDYPHQFSGGMKQRVGIAIALACEPELILADEPTTALDVTIQAQVLALMKELRNKFNTAMLLITHDLGVVAEVCDSVAIMYAGEIIEYGSVEQIFYNDDHHPYTKGLFGSIPSMSAGQRRLRPIDGLMPDPSIQIEGCPFASRCPQCSERCVAEKPAVHELESGHMVKCHLFDKKEAE